METEISKTLLDKPKAAELKQSKTIGELTDNKDFDRDFKWVVDAGAWAYDEEVAKFVATELERKNWVANGSAVGPAVPIVFGSLALVWTSFLVTPYIGMLLTDCPAEGQLLASYPPWIWVLAIPFFAACFFLEWKTMKYAILPLYHQCMARTVKENDQDSPKTIDTQKVFSTFFYDHQSNGSYRSWLTCIGAVGFVNHLSIISNGLFLVKVLKAQQCAAQGSNPSISLMSMLRAGWYSNNSRWQMDIVWTRVMQQSSLKNIPFLGEIVTSTSFVQIVILAWALMLLQPLYALLTTVPTERLHCEPGPDYKIGRSQDRRDKLKNQSQAFLPREGPPLKLQYRTATWAKHNHVQALFHLAEGARMASVSALRVRALQNYLEQRMDDKKFKTGHNQLNVLRSINATAFARYILVGLLENSAMLNIQISSFAMDAFIRSRVDSGTDSLTHIERHFQMYVSIVSALAIGLWKVGDAVSLMISSSRDTWKHGAKDEEHGREGRRCFLHLSITFIIIGVTAFLCTMLLAVSKLAMLYVCPHQLWNFEWGMDQMKGCVEMSEIVREELNGTGWEPLNNTVSPRYLR